MSGVLSVLVASGVPFMPTISDLTVSATGTQQALVGLNFNGDDQGLQSRRGELTTTTTIDGSSTVSDRSPEWAGTLGDGAVAPGSYFQIRLTVTSGLSPTSGDQVGSWLSLATSRSWSLSRPQGSGAGTSSGVWFVEIRRNNGYVVDSATYTMSATTNS